MAEKNDSVADEAKSLVKDAVGTFGLIDLILGGVALYGLWLWLRTTIPDTQIFPKTEYDFVNIGLLGFAAALLGKILNLFSSVITAVVLYFLEDKARNADSGSYFNQVKENLKLHTGELTDEDAIQLLKSNALSDPTHIARMQLASDPQLGAELIANENRISIYYGVALLALPYIFYFLQNGWRWYLISLLIVILLFVALGVLEQFSLMKWMSSSLVLHHLKNKQTSKETKKQEPESQQGK
jgi:hypothetical protein